MAKIISFANFKGGVGKTSTTGLVAYNLAKLNYRVLVIDFDAQANLTSLFLKTKANNDGEEDEIITLNTTLMTAINEKMQLSSIKIPIMENLDLIPNAVDFSLYTRYIERNFQTELDKISYFKKLIEPLKSDYDFIFIDVPPTLSLLNDTAFYACDEIIIVLQTQERSLAGAEVFVEYLITNVKKEYNSDVDVLGILPVLSKKGVAVDKEILRAAIEEFGEQWIFENKINIMERVKRMDLTGITDNPKDIHDKNVNYKFKNVALEIIDRIQIKEGV